MKNLDLIIEKLRKKDFSEFDLFYEETKKLVYFTIISIIKDEEIAKDLMQDTYIKFIDNLDKYESKNPAAYLALMAKNIALNEYNKRKKEIVDSEYVDSVCAEAPPSDLFRILDYLDGEEKEIVLYHIVHNFKFKEIAEITEKPLGTVLWIYNKAIKKLQERKDEIYEQKKY